jgi:hypothetical protein
MDLTAQDIIVDALSLVGATQLDQTPPAWEMNKALRALNRMLRAWSAQKLLVRASTKEDHTLTAGTASYTIGSGATIDTVKPIRITYAYVQDSDGMDHPLDIIEVAQYLCYRDKSEQGIPGYLAYDPGAPQQDTHTGTIYLYYSPNKAYTLYFVSQKILTEFADLTQEFTFEEMYEEAIVYNLAIRLWPLYRKPTEMAPPHITEIAGNGIRAIRAVNSTQSKSKIDIPCSGGGYNIYTDE